MQACQAHNCFRTGVHFTVEGYEGLTFQFPYGTAKQLLKAREGTHKLTAIPPDYYDAYPEVKKEIMDVLSTSPAVAPSCLDWVDSEHSTGTGLPLPSSPVLTRSQARAAQAAKTPRNSTFISSSDGKFTLELPRIGNLQPHWCAVQDFNMNNLGYFRVDTLEKPPHYNCARYSSILDAVLSMTTHQSRLNNPTATKEQQDLALRLTLAVNPMVVSGSKPMKSTIKTTMVETTIKTSLLTMSVFMVV